MESKENPYSRGEQDFDKGIYVCPYPVNSIEEQEWRKAQLNKAYESIK